MSVAIVWFRRDLRLADNPALTAAQAAHERVLPVYVHAPDEEAPWAPGGASRWWLHHSLAALDADLRRCGATLHIARGPSLRALDDLIAKTGAGAVYWNRLYEPAAMARDRAIKDALRARGIAAHSSNAALLFEPWQLQTGQGDPYRVFTPFWRKARTRLQPQAPTAAPARIASPPLPASLPLTALGLLPRTVWDAGLAAAWTPGAAGAQARLDLFGEAALGGYKVQRDFPDRVGTSRLSPHLHFGEVSPRQVVWQLGKLARADHGAAASEVAEPYIRELGWREFAHHLLYHFPQAPTANLNPRFDRFPWAPDDTEALARWQRGRTGIPIVDAGMRELWRSGWMHSRVRMIVASFLTKNLRLHWRHGARWFWDTLVDADLANNIQGWQWSAGSGADAAPYFRIFNPVTQAQRFDPAGRYVRRWLPELAAAPDALLQQPWQDPALLRRCGYPAPMVDLRSSREAALAAYRQMRAGA
ncbi:MAG TPA: deoxyribodipyrimidine photo-lyase [Rhodanobacteraceae bacterium]|nr:deoxyribodipyrimidine photo-lyase [Rhodanobacteraceae bacterium]